MRPAIFLPTFFGCRGALRTLLPIGDRLEDGVRNATFDQVVLGGFSAHGSQREVVLG